MGPNSSHDETQWKKGHSIIENMHPGKFQRADTIYFTRERFPGISKTWGKVLVCDVFHNSTYLLHVLKNKYLIM